MQQVKLYNTRTKSLEEFHPLSASQVKMYCCGPTVYSRAHLGNFRAFLFNDLLRRTLTYVGYEVLHVMNITDVGHLVGDGDEGEDKMELGKKREGLNAWGVAEKYTALFLQDLKRLHILPPSILCKATDHIEEQIAMVALLEEKGFTYKTPDGVYFDTQKFPRYAEFARLQVEELQGGIRVSNEHKKSKTDFALWKFSPSDQKRDMEWDSPWGKGFPGWHIECSAMAMKYLGVQFDIHTGGVDHIPVHHTNEIAQTECTTGCAPSVQFWMHNEFVVTEKNEKLSKSTGTFLSLDDLDKWHVLPESYRYLTLMTHYRKQMKLGRETLMAAHATLRRLQDAVKGVFNERKEDTSIASEQAHRYQAAFKEALADDLNAPRALAVVWGVVDDASLPAWEKYELLKNFDLVLGLNLIESATKEEELPKEIQRFIEARNLARKEKRWGDADLARDELISRGYIVLDSSHGTQVKKK